MVFINDVPVGSFSFDSIGTRRVFTEHEIELCRAFAHFADETMIANAQLLDWFERFESATRAISSATTPERLLTTIALEAKQLFAAESAGFYQRQYDDSGVQTLRHAASTQEGLTGHSLPKGVGMAWDLIDSVDAFRESADYATYPNRDDTLAERFGSVLEVPLLRRSDRIGVIYLSDKKGRTFTASDAAFLQRFADMATLALQHETLIRRLEALSGIAAEITSNPGNPSLTDKLTDIARHAAGILSAELCGVFTVGTGDVLRLRASYGHREDEFTRGMPFQLTDADGSGLTGAIASRLIADYARDGRAVFNETGEKVRKDPSVIGRAYPGQTRLCHSILALPLVRRGRGEPGTVIGMLRVCNKRGVDGLPADRVPFTDEDEWILRIFAEAVVIAIDSATLSELLDRARDGVHRVAKDLAIGDEHHALQNVVDGIRSATGSDIVALHSLRDSELFGPPVISGVELPHQVLQSALHSAVGRVLNANTMHTTTNAAADPILAGPFVERERIISAIATPIWVERNEAADAGKLTVGVLFVNYRTLHEFSEDELKTVKMFSHLAAVTIRNQDLFEGERRKATTEAALREAGEVLTKVTDIRSAAKSIAQQAHKVATAAGVDVTLTAVAVGTDTDSEILEFFPEDTEATSIARFSGFDTPDRRSPRHLAMKTDLGTIFIESRAAAIKESQPFLLFTQLAFDALRAARQHEDLEAARLREDSLTEVALFYIKSGVVAHRHRGTVRNFVGWSKMLKKDASTVAMSSRLRSDLQHVMDCASALQDLLNQTTSRVESLVTVRLNTTLSDWQSRLRDDPSFGNVETDFDLSATTEHFVKIDPDLMREVFSIFATNSHNAMRTRAVKRFSVRTSDDGSGKCRIAIADTGSGIDRKTLERIRKGLPPADGSGSGIGLRTVHLILKNFGGDIADVTTGTEGTTFTISLPQEAPDEKEERP